MILDFDNICTAIAAFLAVFAVSGYRRISMTIFFGFLAHNMASYYGLIETKNLDGWKIHAVYVVIETLTIYALTRNENIAFTIVALILILMGYNILVFYSYFSNIGAGFWNAYSYFAGAIVIMQLMYMFFISKFAGGARDGNNNDNSNRIDKLFCIRPRVGSGDIL